MTLHEVNRYLKSIGAAAFFTDKKDGHGIYLKANESCCIAEGNTICLTVVKGRGGAYKVMSI